MVLGNRKTNVPLILGSPLGRSVKDGASDFIVSFIIIDKVHGRDSYRGPRRRLPGWTSGVLFPVPILTMSFPYLVGQMCIVLVR